MAFERQDMSGVLFKNKDKQKDTHPDYKGNALVDGVDYWMDAWIKTNQDGSKRLSVAFKRKEKQSAPPASRQQPRDGSKQQPSNKPPAPDNDDSNSIPF